MDWVEFLLFGCKTYLSVPNILKWVKLSLATKRSLKLFVPSLLFILFSEESPQNFKLFHAATLKERPQSPFLKLASLLVSLTYCIPEYTFNNFWRFRSNILLSVFFIILVELIKLLRFFLYKLISHQSLVFFSFSLSLLSFPIFKDFD